MSKNKSKNKSKTVRHEMGQLIKNARIKKGLTQLQLASALGFKIPQFISLIENGRADAPLYLLKKIILLLDIDKKIVVKILVNSYTDSITKEL